MIRWEWRGLTMKVDPRWKVRGWAIKKKLDQEMAERLAIKEGKGEKTGPTLGEV